MVTSGLSAAEPAFIDIQRLEVGRLGGFGDLGGSIPKPVFVDRSANSSVSKKPSTRGEDSTSSTWSDSCSTSPPSPARFEVPAPPSCPAFESLPADQSLCYGSKLAQLLSGLPCAELAGSYASPLNCGWPGVQALPPHTNLAFSESRAAPATHASTFLPNSLSLLAAAAVAAASNNPDLKGSSFVANSESGNNSILPPPGLAHESESEVSKESSAVPTVSSTDAEGSGASSQSQASQDESEAPVPANPGSIGHPELCPRPCLYFATGSCTNGLECHFCHGEHGKRVAHLDKRHRALVDSLGFVRCLGVALPILEAKAESLNIRPEVLNPLVDLELELRMQENNGEQPALPASNKFRAFVTSLRSLTIRSLLMVLQKSAAANKDVPERAQSCIEVVLRAMQSDMSDQASL